MKKIFYIVLLAISGVGIAQTDSIQINTPSPTQGNVLERLSIDSLNLSQPKTYELGGLTLTGGVPFTTNQILRYIGLEIGESIQIPGPKLNNALKKLWRRNLFTDVELFATKVEGNKIFLRLHLTGLPSINNVEITGVKKGKKKEILEQNKLTKGAKLTENLINQTKINVNKYFTEKGYPDASVDFIIKPATDSEFARDIVLEVHRGPRVKIKDINISGNTEIKSGKIRRSGFKETKRKSIFRRNILEIFKSSKYIPEKYNEDLVSVIDLYKSRGFRDAKIVDDTIKRIDEKNYEIDLTIDEGNRYYLGDVTYVGNTAYNSEVLDRIFSFKKGDPYDAVGIQKRVSDPQEDVNISSLYLDNGYLFANVTPIEKSVVNDTINLEIRINEGQQATWDKVTFNGNTQTHDHVITRELATLPGELFSKRDIKRTYLKLGALGFFDPQQISQNIVPHRETNTVDIDWGLAPKGSSQIELQGGYGGKRFIGTLGLTFQNFSLANLFKGKAWTPVPLGDGQALSLRAQAGSAYSNFSLSFTEPWIGGSRPTALSMSIYNSNYKSRVYGDDSRLTIVGASVGLSKLLVWPDDYFRFSQNISYQHYNFNNYPFNVGNRRYDVGKSNNLSYQIGLSRLSAGPDAIFPTSGSEFSITAKFTPPYSLFSNKDYEKLKEAGDFDGLYKWLEFYKVQFKANWYKELVGKLVLRTGTEFGILGAYNKTIGISPFERFYMGGTGLQSNRFDGREIVPLRGYEDFSNAGGSPTDISPLGGGTIFNKFLLELRYPITMGQQAKIYGLTFFEAGNTWLDHNEFKPFELKRSAGVGVRVFMSAFGMLGFDFGYGFDDYPTNPGIPSGWQTHFIFGQQL